MANSYKIIEYLCSREGVKPGKLCSDIGISRGILSDLKAGRTKELSAPNMQKIANYFNVSTDIFNDGAFEETLPNNADIELLEAIHRKFSLKKEAPAKTGESLQDLKDDERVLLDSYRGMTEKDRELMRDFARRLKGDS